MSKHFTTNGHVRDARMANAQRIRQERQQREQDRRALRELQRTFDARSGRVS